MLKRNTIFERCRMSESEFLELQSFLNCNRTDKPRNTILWGRMFNISQSKNQLSLAVKSAGPKSGTYVDCFLHRHNGKSIGRARNRNIIIVESDENHIVLNISFTRIDIRLNISKKEEHEQKRLSRLPEDKPICTVNSADGVCTNVYFKNIELTDEILLKTESLAGDESIIIGDVEFKTKSDNDNFEYHRVIVRISRITPDAEKTISFHIVTRDKTRIDKSVFTAELGSQEKNGRFTYRYLDKSHQKAFFINVIMPGGNTPTISQMLFS